MSESLATCLSELLGIISETLSPVEVSHLLASCAALWSHRQRVWAWYWKHHQQDIQCGRCGNRKMEPARVVVVAFDTHAGRCLWCTWRTFKFPVVGGRNVLIFCDADCVDRYNTRLIGDLREGNVLDLDQRAGLFHAINTSYRGRDRRYPIGVPAWPVKHSLHKTYSWPQNV